MSIFCLLTFISILDKVQDDEKHQRNITYVPISFSYPLIQNLARGVCILDRALVENVARRMGVLDNTLIQNIARRMGVLDSTLIQNVAWWMGILDSTPVEEIAWWVRVLDGTLVEDIARRVGVLNGTLVEDIAWWVGVLDSRSCRHCRGNYRQGDTVSKMHFDDYVIDNIFWNDDRDGSAVAWSETNVVGGVGNRLHPFFYRL